MNRIVVCFWLLLGILLQDANSQPPASSSPSDVDAARNARLRYGIMPKQETGALRHLKKYPEADGRGIIVAIFDTGVDPGAPGLQITSDGKPKMIDVIDGTGGGDVPTTTTRPAKGNQLEGLSGRMLKIDPAWNGENKTYRLGLKRGFDLFPVELHPRLKRERTRKFDDAQHRLLHQLRTKLVEMESVSKPTKAQKANKTDLEVQIAQLVAMRKSHYEDPGPIYDCVVLKKNGRWYAVVDTDEDSDLTDERLLTNFRAERAFGTFPGAEMNFAINIFDDGKLISIVTDSGDHGTHVAGIVGGYFPEAPEFNGIAPGVQFVSVKIGDTRLESMETGAGLVRGLRAVKENGCHLINMSYGEASSRTNGGRLISMFEELVDKHQVIFVAAAGNEGPALSTIITPGGSSAVIGVGAYISPAMMEAEYAVRKSYPGLPYTWSSRGPTPDGHSGVDIFAPGGAIAPVPNWTLTPSLRMNGTSMACPNTCGGIALLLSKLKQEKQTFGPGLIRRAIRNTAAPVKGTEQVAQGSGLLQVDRAMEYLLANNDTARNLDYRVSVGSQRGIYLREPPQLARATLHQVAVKAVFPPKLGNEFKIQFRKQVKLKTTVDWAEVGHTTWLTSSGASFEVKVDPTTLKPGLHSGEVVGYDASRMNEGPLFRVPLVATIPTGLSSGTPHFERKALAFANGTVQRFYLMPPATATFATVRLKFHDPGKKRFVVQAIQLVQDKDFREGRHERWLRLDGAQEIVWPISVIGGRTMELCLGQYWSSMEKMSCDAEVTFQSIAPSTQQVGLRSGDPAQAVDLAAPLGRQRIKPTASLTTHRRVVRPSSSKLTPLSVERDTILGKAGYQLVIEYEIPLEKKSSLTPRFLALDGFLYDGELESQMWMVFDGGKRRIGTDDIWPDPVSFPAGKNRLRLHLRHTNAAVLEALKSIPLHLDQTLPSPISVRVYGHLHDARKGSPTLSAAVIESNERRSVYIAPPATKSLPKASKPGDIFLGSVTFGDDSTIGWTYGKRPGGFPLQVVHAGSADAAKTASSPSVSEYFLSRLKNVDGNEKDKFLKRMVEAQNAGADKLKILAARVEWLDQEKYRKDRLDEVVKACDAVLDEIDQDKIAQQLGVRATGKNAAERKKAEEAKKILVDILYRKGRALGYMELPDVIKKHPIANREEHNKRFEANFAELQRWVDTTDKRYFLLQIRFDRRAGRKGAALKTLNKHIKDLPPNKWYHKKRHDLFSELGWKHWLEYERAWRLLRFPSDYQDF